MDWTADAIDRLRALWAEGLSTAEIGRRMGVSKNAVVGKAHRLNLSARPSPIRRDAEAGAVPPHGAATPAATVRRVPSAPRVAPPAQAAGGTAMAAIPAATTGASPSAVGSPGPVAAAAPLAAAPPPARPPAPPVAAPAPAAAAVPPAVVRPFPRLGGAKRSCCWPIGEPGTADFRFCTAESITGKPYCPEHAAVAYVKARDRREDAA